MRKSFFPLSCAASTVFFLHGNEARAQALDAETKVHVQDTTRTEDGAQQADTSEAGGQDIIVTAQRRTERLEDVPIAITALTGEDLAAAGIFNATDLTSAVPSLNFARSSFSGQPTIRGVGTRNTSNGDEANVATYIDGVYQSKPFALFSDLTDISSIQVLRGPQGTLFGRNATGGAILIATRDPDRDLTVDADVTYGSFDLVRGHAYFSAAITERVGFNLSAVALRDHGYLKDVVNGADVGKRRAYYIRSKLRIDIGPDTDLTVIGVISRDRNDAFAETSSFRGNTSARTSNPTPIIANQPFDVSSDLDNFNIVKNRTAAILISHDFGRVRLSSTGSYQKAKLRFLSDSDRTKMPGAFSDITYDNDALTQELILASEGPGGFQWTVGGFYYSSIDRTAPAIVQPNALALNSRMETEALAIFGEGTLRLGNLYLTAGGRYSSEDRNYEVAQTRPTVVNTSNKADFGNFTPRVIARYEFNPSTSVYASYSRGFKSGIFNGNSADVTPVEPERLAAYEMGLKFASPSRSFRFNAAAFYYDYANLQVQTVGPNLQATVLNAASTRIYGVDGDLTARVSDAFSLRGGFSLISASFTKFPSAQLYEPRVLANGSLAGNISSFGAVSGNRLIRTPEYSVNVGGTYEAQVGYGSIELSGNAFLSGNYFFDVQNRIAQPSYVMLNASITWKSPDQRFELSVFGENLADEVIFGSVVRSGRGDAVTYQRPRSFGVRAGVHF